MNKASKLKERLSYIKQLILQINPREKGSIARQFAYGGIYIFLVLACIGSLSLVAFPDQKETILGNSLHLTFTSLGGVASLWTMTRYRVKWSFTAWLIVVAGNITAILISDPTPIVREIVFSFLFGMIGYPIAVLSIVGIKIELKKSRMPQKPVDG